MKAGMEVEGMLLSRVSNNQSWQKRVAKLVLEPTNVVLLCQLIFRIILYLRANRDLSWVSLISVNFTCFNLDLGT